MTSTSSKVRMAEGKSNFFRIPGNLSYTQKLTLIIVCFFLAFGLSVYLFIREKVRQLDIIEIQIAGANYLKPIEDIQINLLKHQLAYQRSGFDRNSFSSETNQLDPLIQEDFRKLAQMRIEFDQALASQQDAEIHQAAGVIEPQEIEAQWERLRRAINDKTAVGTNPYEPILENLQLLTRVVASEAQLSLFYNLLEQELIQASLYQFPLEYNLIMKTLGSLETLARTKEPTAEQKAAVTGVVPYVKETLSNKRRRLNLETILSDPDAKSALEAKANAYFNSTDEFGRLLSDLSTTNGAILKANEALEANVKLWNSTNDQIIHLLQQEHDSIKHEIVIYLFTVLSFFALGVILSLLFIREWARSLVILLDASRSIAAGNLTTTVPITHVREIDILGEALNHVARYIENAFSQLHNLSQAIKALANGDFSARVSVNHIDDEIGQVAISFNIMAQSFEEVIGQLHQLGVNLTTSATQIGSAAKQQESTILEQEATTREISVTANKISNTAKEFATTVSEISTVVEKTAGLAATGKEALNNMELIMRQMVDASGNIAAKLAILNEKASNITSVITTITKVADQTNLLSLNAAIEAEKAGEYGRSFAVIAREIRRLADQTAFATLDIEKIVNEIMGAVSSSVMGVDDFTQEIRAGVDQVGKVGGHLTGIVEQVQALSVRFEAVNQGMQIQSAGAEQINDAISQLSLAAQKTTESIQQFRDTIQKLNNASNDLRVAVAKMKK